MGFLRFATKVIGFCEVIILARILLPAQFGAYGVALLALGLLEVFTETGINVFLIQEKSFSKYINSAWIVSIGRGFLIGIVLFLLAPLISVFFHSGESLDLLRLISIVPVLRGFMNPAIIKFQKNLLFGRDFFYKFTILLIDTSVSITAAYILKSPVGIVVGLLAGVTVELVLSFFVVTPRPCFSFNKKYLVQIFHRGKWVTAAGMFDYLYENLDNIVVGRMLGAGALGVYQMAYSLAVVPVNEIGKVFVHVTTPVMINFSKDKGRLKNAYIKTVGSVFLLVVPVVFILVFFPSLFVLILGYNWTQISKILPVLAVLGLVRSLVGTSSAVFLSKKKQNYITVTTFITIIGLSVAIIPMVDKYGLVGAAVAGLIGTVIAIPVTVYLVMKIL